MTIGIKILQIIQMREREHLKLEVQATLITLIFVSCSFRFWSMLVLGMYREEFYNISKMNLLLEMKVN